MGQLLPSVLIFVLLLFVLAVRLVLCMLSLLPSSIGLIIWPISVRLEKEIASSGEKYTVLTLLHFNKMIVAISPAGVTSLKAGLSKHRGFGMHLHVLSTQLYECLQFFVSLRF